MGFIINIIDGKIDKNNLTTPDNDYNGNLNQANSNSLVQSKQCPDHDHSDHDFDHDHDDHFKASSSGPKLKDGGTTTTNQNFINDSEHKSSSSSSSSRIDILVSLF